MKNLLLLTIPATLIISCTSPDIWDDGYHSAIKNRNNMYKTHNDSTKGMSNTDNNKGYIHRGPDKDLSPATGYEIKVEKKVK